MRREKIISLGEAIEEWIASNNLQKKLGEISVLNHWHKIVGAHFAQLTKRKKIENGILFISTESSVIRHELQITKTKLRNRINQYFGNEVVKEIKIDVHNSHISNKNTK